MQQIVVCYTRLLVEELRKTLIAVWQGGKTAISPESLFSVIWKVVPRFRYALGCCSKNLLENITAIDQGQIDCVTILGNVNLDLWPLILKFSPHPAVVMTHTNARNRGQFVQTLEWKQMDSIPCLLMRLLNIVIWMLQWQVLMPVWLFTSTHTHTHKLFIKQCNLLFNGGHVVQLGKTDLAQLALLFVFFVISVDYHTLRHKASFYVTCVLHYASVEYGILP